MGYIINIKFWLNDGRKWSILVDKSKINQMFRMIILIERSCRDQVPELVNIHMPTGKFAISGLRVFGHGKERSICSEGLYCSSYC